MSYDLVLVFPAKLGDRFISGVAADVGLRVEHKATVSTFFASDGRAMFQANGPYRVVARDVVEAVLETVPRPRWGLLISSPASAAENGRTLAIAVAAAMAGANRGAVYDPQAERVLFPELGARVRQALDKRIRLVRISWLVEPHRALREVSTSWLELVRRHFPSAVPRRYGMTEPMQHRLDRDGDDDFIELWEDANQENVLASLYFDSSPPCYGGNVELPGPRPTASTPITIGMDFDGRVLETTGSTREACVELFTAVADAIPCFYAAGYVERDWEVDRGVLHSGNETETVHVLSKGHWRGLPPSGVWLSWYGAAYKERVRSSIAGLPLIERKNGVMLRIGETPQDADQLIGRFPSLPLELTRTPQPLPPSKPGIIRKGYDNSLPARIALT